MALLNWLSDRVYDTFYKDDKKRLEQSNAAYQQQVQAHKQRNVLSPQQYSQQLRGAAQAANNQVAYNAPAQRQRPQPQYNPTGVNTQQITQPRPTFTPQPRVSEAIRSNTVVSQNKPNALQYFNPLDAERGLFGSKGVFGAEQQQRFTNAVAPAVNKLEEIQKNIDAGDDKEGFQWTSPGDYGRFGAKLLPGMAQGIIEAPTKVGEAMSGQRVRDNKVEDINGLQRAGTLADAVISTAGIAVGGSGTLLRSVLPGAKQAGKQATASTLQKLAGGAYNTAKDAGKEGLEEVVQTFATDLADDGAVNTDLSQYRDAATLGALGGSMFHGAGKTVEYAKSIPGKVDASIHTKLTETDPDYQQLTQQFETTTNELERSVLDQKMKQARQQVIKDKVNPVVAMDKVYGAADANAQRAELARTELITSRQNLQRAFDVETDPIRRKQINQGIAQINKQIREGGFLAGPLAGDFSKAKKDGLVFDGVDGKPRFEVDDSGAKIKNPNGKTLGELIDHPELYRQYPQVKDAKIGQDLVGTEKAHYDPLTNTINKRADATLGDTLHEVQHVLQTIEGRGNGTSPAAHYRNLPMENASLRRGLDEVNPKIAEARRKGTDATKLIERRDNYIRQLNETQDQYGNVKDSKAEAYRQYKLDANEAEARAVQSRMNMPMSERYVKQADQPAPDTVRLYRGLEQEFDPKYNINNSDAPTGYSTFTDNPELARQYAGKKGYVYQYDFPKNKLAKDIIDEDGERGLFLDNEKKAGLNGVSGKEYLVYNHHDDYNPANMKLAGDSPRSTFYNSLDVPKQDLIIKNGEGKAMSIEPEADVSPSMRQSRVSGGIRNLRQGNEQGYDRTIKDMLGITTSENKARLTNKPYQIPPTKKEAIKLITEPPTFPHHFLKYRKEFMTLKRAGFANEGSPFKKIMDELEVLTSPEAVAKVTPEPPKAMSIEPKAPQVGKTLKDGELYSTANSYVSFGSDSTGGVISYNPKGTGSVPERISYNKLSQKTRDELVSAELEYKNARANSTSPVAPGAVTETQIAMGRLELAQSNAIEELGLQEHASIQGARLADGTKPTVQKPFLDRYTDWLESKWKSKEYSDAQIQDMESNPNKYKAQFESETSASSPEISQLQQRVDAARADLNNPQVDSRFAHEQLAKAQRELAQAHTPQPKAEVAQAKASMSVEPKHEKLYHGTGKDFQQFGLNQETRQARAEIAKLNDERGKLVESGKIEDNALTIPEDAKKRIAQIDKEIQEIYQRPNIMPSSVKEKGVYLTSDKKYAQTFAGKDGRILETTADIKNPYVIKNQDEIDLIEDAAYYPEIIDRLESEGYDGIKAPDGQVLVFDPSKVKVATPVAKPTLQDALAGKSTKIAPKEAKEIKMMTLKTAEGKNEYVAQLGNSVTDRVGKKTGFKAESTSPNFKTEGEMNKWIQKNTELSPTANSYAHEATPDEILNDTVDYWYKHGKETKGGQMIDTTGELDAYGSGIKRISEHNQFYSDFYKAMKRAPTKKDYEKVIRTQLEKGGGNMVDPDMAAAYQLAKTTEAEKNASLENAQDTTDYSGAIELKNALPEVQTTSMSNNKPIQAVPLTVAKKDTVVRSQQVSSDPKKSAKARTIQSPERQSRNNAPLDKKTPESQSGREPDSSSNTMTKQEIKQYVKDMSDDQDSARKSDNGNLLEKAKDTKADFKEKFIDDLSPIEDRLNKAIKDGVKIDPKDHITYQLDRSRRSEGLTHAYMIDSGLADIVENVPDTKEFDQYLIAKHAQELDSEIVTGRNKAKDRALVKALEPKYADYAKRIYKYNQSLLDSAVDYGLISKDTATQLKKQYPEYVPFNRIFNEEELTKLSGNGSGEASISSQSAVQKIKGSQRAIESPLNSIIDKTRVVIEQGERNRAAKMLADYRTLPGNPFNLTEVPPTETIGTRSSISYLDKGVKRTFLTDKTIADAAKSMTRDQLGLWGRIAAVPARVLRSGATAANVGFAGANIVKDVVGAGINSKHPFRIANPKAMGNALAAALHHNGKQYQELMREGVAGTSFDMFRNATHLNAGEVRSQKNVGTRALYNLRPDRWYRTFENTIGRSEDFGRALQYYSNKQGYLKEGKTAQEATILAADQARNNSTNFFRHGSWGKNINQAIPYWNAGVQGARIQTVRLKQRPVQTLAKIGLAIAAPSAMIALNNYSDEEKEKVIENIPEYEKAGNIIIVGNDAKFNEASGRWEGVWKFPVPPQHLGIHNAVQNAVKSAKKGEEYDLISALGEITQNYTTINPTNATKTANNYTPQALKLAAEPLTNTNFFTGDKIIPDSMRNLDKENQTTKSTSLTAKALAKVGGLSPMMVDNVIRTATGGAGQNLVWATDRSLAQAGFGKMEDARGRDMTQSILDRFVGARGQSDGLMYFKTLDENAKEQKLAGKDLSIFNSLVDQKMSSTGEIEGKTERDTLNKYQNLANNPRVAKTFAEAAKDRSRISGQPLDPLYSLTDEQQSQFYLMRSVPKDSADQRNLEKLNESWYKTFTEDRSKYYKALDLPPPKNSQRVPYPEASPELETKLQTYYTLNPEQRGEMLDKNPDISEQFTKLSTYANEVRKAQGFAPMRTYPQASERVQKLMDAGDFKDTEVAQFMQDLNMYNLTSEGALAQIQGNTMSSKGLKATKNLGYSIVKNADGTYSLKYPDTQGGAQLPATPDGEVTSGNGTRSTRSSKARTSKARVSKGRSGRSGGSKRDNDGIDVASAKAAMKIKTPTTKSPPKVATAKMKQAPLRQYQVINGKRVPIKVSGRKRIA